MRFLVVLLLVLQVNSLQADEIFNLIKIPNLEVYKIDNNQGLKYLNSKQNFIIGVKNNIKCDKANNTILFFVCKCSPVLVLPHDTRSLLRLSWDLSTQSNKKH